MSGSLNKVMLIGRLGQDPESEILKMGDHYVPFLLLQVNLGTIKILVKKEKKLNGIV